MVVQIQVFNPHNSKSSQRMQAKTVEARQKLCVCVLGVVVLLLRFFWLPDGLIYVSFLSYFSSVQLWLLMLFFRMAEATFILSDDVCVQFF
jgi:hypothetical protein